MEINLDGINTQSSRDMSFMFHHCFILTSLNISSFRTPFVENMESMFNKCSNLIELDLSQFVLTHVTNMKSMFKKCISFKSLRINGHKKGINIEEIFLGCSSLNKDIKQKFIV